MGTERLRQKKDRRLALMVAVFPTDAVVVSKCGLATPTRMRRTINWGIQAHLVAFLVSTMKLISG